MVDVGAGTGKLTRQLVPTGAHVIAVEPLPEMRGQLEAAVPGVEVLAGSAEEMPLPDGSADGGHRRLRVPLVRPERALPEIHRVLRSRRRPGHARQRPRPRRPAPAAIQRDRRPATCRAGEILSWIPIWRRARSSARRRTFRHRSSSSSTPKGSPSGSGRSRTSRGSPTASGPRCSRGSASSARRSLSRRSRSGTRRTPACNRVCKGSCGGGPFAILNSLVKAPKILAVASAVDLDFRYGCTPAWWQLWKGLHEAGCDLIVTPYRGRPVESPWWRTAPNPCYREGEAFARARDAVARLKGDRYLRRAEERPGRHRPARPRGDLALGDAALARAPRRPARAGARRRRGRRLHRADEPPARDPDAAARALRRAGRLLRRRRADEPSRVRRHGHRLQLLLRRRPVRVRPRRLELGGRARPAARARRAPRGGGLLGRRPGALPAARRSRRRWTSSSTATATSSGRSGWTR